MKAIGYWIRDALDQEFIHPAEIAGQMNPADVTTVAAYLRAGVMREQYRGYSWCRFRCGIHDEEMGTRDLSDGDWLWPEGLVHYVESHCVALPEEFVAHVRNGITDKPVNTLADPEFGFWIDWCRQRRNPAYLAQLEEARRTGETQLEERIAVRASTLETEQGLGDIACVWQGCQHRALASSKLCAHHSISPAEREYMKLQCTRVPDYPTPA